MRRTVLLVVLDGFGLGPQDHSNPVWAAQPKTLLGLMRDYPTTSLQASGIEVGLPWGEIGNSEVGHLTLGAGRVMYQHFPRITMSIHDGSFFKNEALMNALAHAKTQNRPIHFVGLLTDVPVHAHIEHLQALMKAATDAGVPFWLHLFTDGKDSVPHSITKLLARIPQERIASISGRYYGMDRTDNWDLTKQARAAMTGEVAVSTSSVATVIEAHLNGTQSEEFLPPVRLAQDGAITNGDSVFFFNFREDSMRQIGESFLLPGFSQFPTTPLTDSFFATMTRYKAEFVCPVAFDTQVVTHPLAEVLASAGKTQLRISESYKYAHITYFFNALTEKPYANEYRVLIPSLQVTNMAEHPELRAREIGDRVLQALAEQSFDFVLVNFPNGDMIGHTGNYDACVKAVQVLDEQLARIMETVGGNGAIVCITGDHGNVERVFNPVTGRPDTGHDPNPVPFILIAPELKGHRFLVSENLQNDTGGTLADVAPTLLDVMQIPKPPEMTGMSLLKSLI